MQSIRIKYLKSLNQKIISFIERNIRKFETQNSFLHVMMSFKINQEQICVLIFNNKLILQYFKLTKLLEIL